ncbi:MAG TPA: serine hydrolase [Parafilimonas sp.]|nr:serine hydrolase [Parafilimonas sp.]
MKIALLLLLLPMTANSQKDYTVLIDSFMKAEVEVNHFNGNVLIAKEGKIIYKKSFGYSNYDTKELLNSNSMFEIGCLSSQFIAMGILQLQKKGKLRLSDSLTEFFPELPYANVTIHQMLTHTSGLPDYYGAFEEKWDKKKVAYNKDVVDFLAKEDLPAEFEPGKGCNASGTDYELLVAIIEKISGQSISEFLQLNIFDPLNMKRTRVYNTRRAFNEVISNYAYGYVYDKSLSRYVLPDSINDNNYNFVSYTDGICGTGGISSTTGDLFIWDRALKNYTLLNKNVQEIMLSPYSLWDTASNEWRWAYGSIRVGKNELGEYIHPWDVWVPGYRCDMIRYVKDDIAVIVLSNKQEYVSRLLSGTLVSILKNKTVINPYVHKEITIDTLLLSAYTGNYLRPDISNPLIIKFFLQKGKLTYQHERHTTLDIKTETKGLLPESERKFFAADGSDIQIEFEIDESGNVSRAFFIFKGVKKEMKKLN